MATTLFAKGIFTSKPARVYKNQQIQRDSQYYHDIVEDVVRVLHKSAEANLKLDKNHPDPSRTWTSHREFNIVNSNPIPLMDIISCLEKSLSMQGIRHFRPVQRSDLIATTPKRAALEQWAGLKNATLIEQHMGAFEHWYLSYYRRS